MVWIGFRKDASGYIFNGKGIELIDEWLSLDDDDVNMLLWNI